MSLPVAILAGGLATRLFPQTTQTPKSLIEVAGDFFINHQLHYLHQQNILQVVLCLGHLGEQIEAVVGDGSAYGLEVHYSWDGASLLGTGGALRQALPLLGEEFFVLYGDTYLPVDFAAVMRGFYANRSQALLTVFKNKNQGDKSNVLMDKQRIIEYNKRLPLSEMNYIDYGLSILSSEILQSYPVGESFDLADLYHELSLRGQLASYEVFERFYEIGSISGLRETTRYLEEQGNFYKA